MGKMNDSQKSYESLKRLTMMLTLALVIIIILAVVSFYKGWLGAPGKIYFSPDESQYYVRCADNPDICGSLGICEKVTIIKSDTTSIEDSICIKR